MFALLLPLILLLVEQLKLQFFDLPFDVPVDSRILVCKLLDFAHRFGHHASVLQLLEH